MGNFQQDLQFGQRWEDIFIQQFAKHNSILYRPKGYFREFDVEIDGIRYEVKADKRTHSTNNVCIEYEHTGKPSGISTTTADFYIYFVISPDNSYVVYKIPTHYIRELIDAKKYHRVIHNYDDAVFYLFDICLFAFNRV